MDQNRTKTRQNAPRVRETGWGMPVGAGAAVLCAVGLWGQYGGAAHGPAIAATLLAGAVLALTLVLALTTRSR